MALAPLPSTARLDRAEFNELLDDDTTTTIHTTTANDNAYSSLRGGAKRIDSVLDISLPKSVVVSGSGGRGYRSMSLPSPTRMANVNASVESVESPPGLTSSMSNSEDDEGSEVLFEEQVVLDSSSAEDCNLPPDSRPTLSRRPPPKSLHIEGGFATMQRRRSGTSPQLRPLPNGLVRGKTYGNGNGNGNGVLSDQSLNLPNGRSTMQRAVSSPTSPFMRQYPQRIPSRSPSPSKPFMHTNGSQQQVGRSPQSLGGATPKASLEIPKENNGGMIRRTSWQPGRKSVKELEAEYNDEDDEVPDEAILENVPVSPIPGHYHSFRSPSTTSLRSATPSPHRKPSYANLHSANIPKQAKRPSARKSHSPRSPNGHGRPSLPHGATVGAYPPQPRNRPFRSQSWTEDLNDEARQLSQALEEYAGRLSLEKRTSVTNTPSSSPPRTGKKTPAKTSVAEVTTTPLPPVPPLQKGNIMIDPLPISKEKEAVLTRTRPSWLPPKSQKEEKKHMREFQQMMARAAEAEKKRILKEQEAREDREEMQDSIARIWEQHVLPNWDAVIKEPRTRELWWRGVTPRSRGEVWQKALGNDLELTTASFEAALSRANALQTQFAPLTPAERCTTKEAAWLDAIARDVPTTHLPHHLQSTLTDVLKAYTMYRSDIGYVYGTHLIASTICLLLPSPSEAFILLANMLNRPLPLAFLVHDTPAMATTYTLTLQTLKYKLPTLHAHLTSPALALHPQDFLDPIFRCLFTYNLPHEHICRIWDVMVFEGDKALIRAAVAILGKLESKLYGSTKEEILEVIGWRNERMWDVDSEEEFMGAVREAGKVDGKA